MGIAAPKTDEQSSSKKESMSLNIRDMKLRRSLQ